MALILAAFLLAGCTTPPTTEPTSPAPVLPPTPTPTPEPPSHGAAAATFLDAWESEDYATMYARLSPDSQAAIDAASFTQRYQNALETATVLTVTTRLQAALREDDRAYVSFQLSLDTALVGTLITDTVMSLSLHEGQWGVDWEEGLIWPQLAGGHYFRVERTTPVRANIYDRAGLGLAAEGTIVTVGVIPGQIEDENALLAALTLVTGLS
ncbi:MAG: hypothetical protein IMY86_08780, partial [Chloroflexi bacterium]|nr:hypothetical protein [Chloroflexota bacterium]